MKKYFLIVSIIIVCLAMCNVTLAASNLKDIAGTKYEDAVYNLCEIGLVNGYPEDNTYRPSVPVTRAQMAKMMVIALGQEDKVSSASSVSSTFSDLKSNHWAFGYINVAKDLGIINGYPDGRFGPEDTVTYAESSAMVLRALGYDSEVAKSTENWPNNYISYAKKLELYDSVGSFDSGKGAARGDVALILWNMLRTGVCTVKSQNSNGLVYGQGQKMLNKYKNYIYEDDAIITSVDFDDDFEEAKVTITGDEKITLTMTDSEVLKYYGRKLEMMYNTKNKKLFSISDKKEYKVVEGSVTKTPTSKKIYIDDDDYTMPDKSNVLLYKIDSISDAVEATLLMDGSTVKYVIASGAKSVYVGLVSETDVTVSKRDGIKLKKLGSTSTTSYALIDEDDMPSKGSVIVYYLNSDNRLGILKEIDVDDASTISSATSTKIKIGKQTYTYSSSSFVVVSATSSKVSSMTFKNIDDTKDLAYVFEYAGKIYLIIYEDSVEDEDAIDDALTELKKYIKDYEYLEKKEASYSQVTFTRFIDAMSNARSMTSSSKLTKINDALTELKDAKANLKAVSSTSTEGKIAAYRAKIRDLLTTAETIVKNKAQYESTSYNKFYAEYTVAKKLLARTDNTEKEAKAAYDDLSSAMSSSNLKKIVDTTEHKEALARLNDALSKYGNAGPESDYTASSYKTYKDAKTNAESAKTNNASKTAKELDDAAQKLQTAYEGLQLAIETLKDELNELIVECISYKDAEEDYMPNTYNAFDAAFDKAMSVRESSDISTIKTAISNLKTAKNNLKLINEVLADTKNEVDDMKDATNVSDALSMPEQNAEDKLNKIENINTAAKNDLEDLINTARDEISNVSGDSLIELLDATSNAQKALNGSLSEIVTAYVRLDNALTKNN